MMYKGFLRKQVTKSSGFDGARCALDIGHITSEAQTRALEQGEESLTDSVTLSSMDNSVMSTGFSPNGKTE